MDADCEISPLSVLHNMLREYRGSLDIPHYIVVSEEFLDYMRDYYSINTFCIRGHTVISDMEVETSEAFVFPEALWNKGDRPWFDDK
jgi:hypothetical protein